MLLLLGSFSWYLGFMEILINIYISSVLMLISLILLLLVEYFTKFMLWLYKFSKFSFEDKHTDSPTQCTRCIVYSAKTTNSNDIISISFFYFIWLLSVCVFGVQNQNFYGMPLPRRNAIIVNVIENKRHLMMHVGRWKSHWIADFMNDTQSFFSS